jgi:hypothetical protein
MTLAASWSIRFSFSEKITARGAQLSKRAAGVPGDCVLHGLRKTTARILAELGVKSAPVTGHLTRAMQDEYERDANQKKMGSAAILSWQEATRKMQRIG